MFDALKSLDLTALPEEVQTAIRAAQHEALDVAMQSANLKRSAVHLTESNAALATQNAELEAANVRLEHYVKELHQLIYGKRSEKLTEDERQLAFEDLEVATSLGRSRVRRNRDDEAAQEAQARAAQPWQPAGPSGTDRTGGRA